MAKKVKNDKKLEIIDKAIETCNYAVIPACGIIAIWTSFDASTYVAAGLGAIASILAFVKLFVKK